MYVTPIDTQRVATSPSEPQSEARTVGFATIFIADLQIGLTAFGFTLLQKVVQLVVGKKG